jgi:hypothetical protein
MIGGRVRGGRGCGRADRAPRHSALSRRVNDLGELMRLVLVAAGRQEGRLRSAQPDPLTAERVRAALDRYWVNEWVRQLEMSAERGELESPVEG